MFALFSIVIALSIEYIVQSKHAHCDLVQIYDKDFGVGIFAGMLRVI